MNPQSVDQTVAMLVNAAELFPETVKIWWKLIPQLTMNNFTNVQL